MKISFKYILIVLGLICLPLAFAGRVQDQPAMATFTDDSFDLQSDSLSLFDPVPYINKEFGVFCIIGRREGQFALETSNKTTSGRMLCLSESLPATICGYDFANTDRMVARMITAQIEHGGIDLRTMGHNQSKVIPISLKLYTNRQNLWRLDYVGVNVTAKPYYPENPNSAVFWVISTSGPGGSEAATIQRINKYNPIDCGVFNVSFSVTVDLLP